MAIDFPRSIRALGNDRFRPSLVTLMITSLLLVAWFGWFFFAPIGQYETSNNFKIGRNGSVTVTLPTATVSRVQTGQNATLQLNPSAGASTTYNGQVLRIPNNGTTAELYFRELAQVPANAQGTVQIEVETTTPAALLLQAIRQSAASLNASPTPVSPAPAAATPVANP